MTLNSVDLPQPDGPMTPRNSPWETANERLSTAVSTPSGVSNRFVTPSTTRVGSLARPTARSSRINCVAAGIVLEGAFLTLFCFPRHRRGHCGCVARFHAHVDHGNLALLDRG